MCNVLLLCKVALVTVLVSANLVWTPAQASPLWRTPSSQEPTVLTYWQGKTGTLSSLYQRGRKRSVDASSCYSFTTTQQAMSSSLLMTREDSEWASESPREFKDCKTFVTEYIVQVSLRWEPIEVDERPYDASHEVGRAQD